MDVLARPRVSRFLGRPTPSGAGAVALAVGGLAAMAVMAAAPGSPYQPILTRLGSPSGPIAALARGIGLGELHGNLLLVLATVITVAATVGFLLLLRACWRGTVSLRTVMLIVLGAHAVLLFVPLLFSRDVYSYAIYGRIAGIYGGNPYVQTPLDHSGDLLWNYIGPKWVDTPAVYGPAWTSLSAALARFLPRPVAHVQVYRLFAITASLATCAAIVWVVRREWPERTTFALAAFGANPVILFHAVGSGHNDLWVAFAIIASVGLVARRHERLAVAMLTLGALVKAVAVLPLILLIVWAVGRRPPDERRHVLTSYLGIAVTIGLAFAVPYLQLHDPSLGMLELAGHEGWLAPSMAFERIVDLVSFDTLGELVRIAFAVALIGGFIALARDVWRRAPSLSIRGLAASWAWAVLLLTLLGPVLLPWYVAWTLPLLWVLPRPARITLISAAALLGVTLWSAEPLRFPGAFTVNTVVAQWLVVPTIVALAFWCFRDLFSRLRVGFPLEDDVAAHPGAPTTEPYHEERVAAAAG
jgi:alpha-1,6-mannosyltransferase